MGHLKQKKDQRLNHINEEIMVTTIEEITIGPIDLKMIYTC